MNEKIITPSLVASLERLKPGQVIFGEPRHPRRVPKQYPRPEYATRAFTASPAIKICYCCQGRCALVLNNTTFLLQPGDLAFINRNTEHHVSFIKEKMPYSLYWFLWQGWGTVLAHQSMYSGDGSFTIMRQQTIGNAFKTYRLINDLVLGGLSEQREWVRVQQGIHDMFRILEQQKVVWYRGLTNKWQKRIIGELQDFLAKNYSQPLTLADIARRFNYSPAYLDTLYKQEYGMGIMQQINMRKMGVAARQLQTSTMNISEVAAQCGFADPHYFRRVFLKCHGITPREYRKYFD